MNNHHKALLKPSQKRIWSVCQHVKTKQDARSLPVLFLFKIILKNACLMSFWSARSPLCFLSYPMSHVTQRVQGEDPWKEFFSVCFGPHFPLWLLRRSGQGWQLLKDALLLPRTPGDSSLPHLYKVKSSNCRISLQTEFLLSPLTTVVNYKLVRGVFDCEECEWWRGETIQKLGKRKSEVASPNTQTCTHTGALALCRETSQTRVNLFFIGLCARDLL